MSNMPKSFEFTEDMVNEVQALNKKPPMLQGDWIKELQFELNKLTPSFSEASKKNIVFSLKETREIWDMITDMMLRKVIDEDTPVRLGQIGILAPFVTAPSIRELVTSWDATGTGDKVRQVRTAALAARKSIKLKRKYGIAIDNRGNMIVNKKDAIEYMN